MAAEGRPQPAGDDDAFGDELKGGLLQELLVLILTLILILLWQLCARAATVAATVAGGSRAHAAASPIACAYARRGDEREKPDVY